MSLISVENFGKYAVISRLGMGGMAELYKCRLTGAGGFEKLVAVKRILPDRSQEPELINMFMDEARLAAHLSHPNIVQIFEIDEQDGLPYIVMEYVRGPTLRALYREALKQNNVHLGHMARIMSEICNGLQYAHHATMADGTPLKLVHRDVSPHNIMVTPHGLPKLLDFGVAKAEGRLSATNVGTIKGKLKYMPPEQLRGEAIDARADVFSAGVCLYEATTGGRLPFAASDAGELELLQAILKGVYTKPSALVPDYPLALEKAILWAIDPDLEKRCGSAREFHDALELFTTSARYASSAPKIGTWMAELFPNLDAPVPSAPPSPGGRSLSVSRASQPSRPPSQPAQQAPSEELSEDDFEVMAESAPPKRGVLYAALAAGLLLVGTGAFWVGRQDGSASLGAVPPAPVVDRALAPADANDTAAIAYMDEAERSAQQRRFGVALDLLRKAGALKITLPQVNIRLSTLTDDVEVQALLFRARNALLQGNREQARQLANDALARHPENAEARAVLASVNGAFVQDAPPVASAVVDHRFPAPPRPVSTGEMAITSNPAPGTASALLPADATPAGIIQTPPPPSRPGMVSRPHLPSVYEFNNPGDLRRVLTLVEGEAMSLGHTGDMVRGVTRLLAEDLLASGRAKRVYPVAMYYFLVREAALGRTHEEAAAELKAVHVNQNLLKLRDLPHVETRL